MVSARTDNLYENMRTALAQADRFRKLVADRERDLRRANAKLRRPRTGSDLDLTIFGDEYFRAHRSDELYHRGWAATYAQLYHAEVMREIELRNLAQPDKV